MAWLAIRGAVIEWKKIGENLVRHLGGQIYLRAKVNGKPVRKSLHTDDLRTAKRKRDAELEKLRHIATLGDDRRDTTKAWHNRACRGG